MRPAVFGCGRDIRALAQFVLQRRAVHLQRAGSAARAGAVETSPHGQPRQLLCQFVPGLLFAELRHPGPGAVSQMENSHSRIRRQHRCADYYIILICHVTLSSIIVFIGAVSLSSRSDKTAGADNGPVQVQHTAKDPSAPSGHAGHQTAAQRNEEEPRVSHHLRL